MAYMSCWIMLLTGVKAMVLSICLSVVLGKLAGLGIRVCMFGLELYLWWTTSLPYWRLG